MAHLRETPKPPSVRIGKALPGTLEQVIMTCLEKDPARRFQSATDLAQALAVCMYEQPVPTHRKLPSRQRTRPPERLRTRPPERQRASKSYAPTYIGRHEWPELQGDSPNEDGPTQESDQAAYQHRYITAH
jgi:serine/threonine-protein kinase